MRKILRLKLGSFTYDRFASRPFSADISFGPAGVAVGVTEADLCGISTVGTVGLFSQEIQLDFKSVSKDQELAPVLACLVNKKGLATGKFDFQGDVTARGKSEQVPKSVQGNLEFIAKKGAFTALGCWQRSLHFSMSGRFSGETSPTSEKKDLRTIL